MFKTLAAIAALAALATAAEAQVTMQPDGGVSCPGAYYAQRLDGRLVIVCPPPPVSKQQADEFRQEWLKAHEAEAARQRKRAHDSGACDEQRVPGQMYTRPPSCD